MTEPLVVGDLPAGRILPSGEMARVGAVEADLARDSCWGRLCCQPANPVVHPSSDIRRGYPAA